jgi:glucan phosphoethanolaminetransferase (alkaline phosphatase superfamily)
MIQRIQHLYFGFVIINLSILLSGIQLCAYEANGMPHQLNAFDIRNGKEVVMLFPLYIVVILLMLLFLAIISQYKKLKLQIKLAKITFVCYLFFVLGITAVFIVGWLPNTPSNLTLGFGYYLLILGLPFTYLGLRGIIRDKNLLDSYNRLR